MMSTVLRKRQENKAPKAKKAWSDWQKWWMDLAKSAITFSVAATVSLLVIDKIQQERAEKRAHIKVKEDALLATRLKALEEFRVAILTGFDDINLVMLELSKLPEKEGQEIDLSKFLAVQTRLVSSINAVTILFPKQEKGIEKVEKNFDLAMQQMHKLIANKKGEPGLFSPNDFLMLMHIARFNSYEVLQVLQADLLGFDTRIAPSAASSPSVSSSPKRP